jgi:hypothetical protein
MIEPTASPAASVSERVDFDRDTDPGFRIHEAGDDPARSVRVSAVGEKKARRARKQAEHALALLNNPQARVETLIRRVSSEAERRPLMSVLVGFGIGFAIGGALSTRLGRMALITAGRYAMKELISGAS